VTINDRKSVLIAFLNSPNLFEQYNIVFAEILEIKHIWEYLRERWTSNVASTGRGFWFTNPDGRVPLKGRTYAGG
jgi:hypothetical protein